ncbi:unnamed protein product [Amaranthus hypochondriacus]
MILRTPPPRKRRAESRPPEDDIANDAPLVIYEDPPLQSSSPQPSDHLLCTYQCRQMVKAELLDNFSNMEKSVTEYQSKLETLNEKLLKAESEAKKYEDQFLYAEQELAAAKGREHALQEKILKEIKESHEQLKKQIMLCNELEVKLKKEESMRKSSESSAAAFEEKAIGLERQLKQLSDSTKRERKNLQDELMHLNGDSKLSVSRLRADLERVQCQADNAENESELLKEKLEDISQQLNKCLSEKNELEKQIARFACPKEDSVFSQNDALVKHLQEELRNYESEVLEARKLKQSHENIELLKEKLIEEKGRREKIEAELVKSQEIQLSMKVLEDELSSWKKITKDIPGVESSDDILLKFVALQKYLP